MNKIKEIDRIVKKDIEFIELIHNYGGKLNNYINCHNYNDISIIYIYDNKKKNYRYEWHYYESEKRLSWGKWTYLDRKGEDVMIDEIRSYRIE